jgi:hypothetical protein
LIRDDIGDVVISGRGRVDHLLNAFHVELVVCLQGTQTVVDLGIGHLIVQTNAKLVVEAITTIDFDEAAVGLLIAEIKFWCLLAFLASNVCLKVENAIKRSRASCAGSFM